MSLVTSASLKGWFHGPVSHILDTHYSPQSAERYNSYKLEESGIRREGKTEEGHENERIRAKYSKTIKKFLKLEKFKLTCVKIIIVKKQLLLPYLEQNVSDKNNECLNKSDSIKQNLNRLDHIKCHQYLLLYCYIFQKKKKYSKCHCIQKNCSTPLKSLGSV